MATTLMTSLLSDSGLWAYLDPSTGSMAFQVMVAGVLSGMVFCRSAVEVIRRRLGLGGK